MKVYLGSFNMSNIQEQVNKHIEDLCKTDPVFNKINERMSNPTLYDFLDRSNISNKIDVQDD